MRAKAAVESVVAPLRETLGKVEGQLRELESARVGAYSSVLEQVVRSAAELRAGPGRDGDPRPRRSGDRRVVARGGS